MNLLGMINRLKEVKEILFDIDDELRKRGFEHMLGYCYTYIDIELDNIKSGKYD